MRTLFIGALAAILAGCSCPLLPHVSMDACSETNGFVCFDRTAESEPVEAELAALHAKPKPAKEKPAIAKAEKAADAGDRATHLDAKNAKSTRVAAIVDPPASGPPAGTSDPVIVKAKATIAARLENPASAEFGEMNRAIRKNVRGESVDTICGRVKGKKASGEDTGDRPFLYLVKDDEAYVVDGSASLAAATAYRNICN
ncbi:MAG: hypothetical protein ACXU9D_01635 [Xanthobacteraceae bacterium]